MERHHDDLRDEIKSSLKFSKRYLKLNGTRNGNKDEKGEQALKRNTVVGNDRTAKISTEAIISTKIFKKSAKQKAAYSSK